MSLTISVMFCSNVKANNPDVKAIVLLPTAAHLSDGVIDMVITTGDAPYQIKYYKNNIQGNPILVKEVIAMNNGDEDLQNVSVGQHMFS